MNLTFLLSSTKSPSPHVCVWDFFLQRYMCSSSRTGENEQSNLLPYMLKGVFIEAGGSGGVSRASPCSSRGIMHEIVGRGEWLAPFFNILFA